MMNNNYNLVCSEYGYKLGKFIYKYRKLIKFSITVITFIIWHIFMLHVIQEMIDDSKDDCKRCAKREYRKSIYEEVNQRQYPVRKKRGFNSNVKLNTI